MPNFESSTFHLPLRTRRRQIWFLAGILLPCLALGAGTLRSAFSETVASSTAVEILSRAAELDTGNPDIQHGLGQALLYGPESPDTRGGLDALKRASALDPLAAGYRLDLAGACESAGEQACADQGFERAVQLEPATPRVRWLAANHDLRKGTLDAAFDDFHCLLTMDRSYSENVFHLVLGAVADPDLVWARVVRRTSPPVEVAYVKSLAGNRQFDAAYQAWNAAMLEARAQASGQTQTFTLADAEPYLDDLIARGESDQALAVWHDLQALGVVPAQTTRNGPANLITNGDFDHPPLNAGLDWRLDPGRYTALSFLGTSGDQTAEHRATRALRLDFTVSRNDVDEPAYQFVPVMPGLSYVLSARVRSEAITSDSGPRLRVVDPACAACLDVATEGAVGTTGWHTVQLAFTTSPTTRFVRVSVFRPRSRSFPSEITGTLWLDALSLVPSATEGAGVTPAPGTGDLQ